jgi:hypothetical protein
MVKSVLLKLTAFFIFLLFLATSIVAISSYNQHITNLNGSMKDASDLKTEGKSISTIKEGSLPYETFTNSIYSTISPPTKISAISSKRQANSCSFELRSKHEIFNSSDGYFYEYSNVSNTTGVSSGKYSVMFCENGLPPGTIWYVNLSNGMKSGPITACDTITNPLINGTYHTFLLTNGTYTFSAASSNKTYYAYTFLGTGNNQVYHAYGGIFTVNGSSLDQPVGFNQVTYLVTIKETGIRSGCIWGIKSTSFGTGANAPYSISFRTTNGTYEFEPVNDLSYYSTVSQFTIIVNGSNTTVTIKYLQYANIEGKISPINANITVKGRYYNFSSSNFMFHCFPFGFNISVPAGSYEIIFSERGYETYYDNVTLVNGEIVNLSYNLKHITVLGFSETDLYSIILGSVAAVSVIGVIILYRHGKK